MLILAIETSSKHVSVALMNESTVLGYQDQYMEQGHGEALIPMIETLMEKTSYCLKNLDAVAVALGPGSFTGVRVGLATARGMGLALQIPVYGVTNFEAVAYGIFKPVTVVLDTKRGDYFTQSFDADFHPLNQPHIQTAEQLRRFLPFVAVGDGADQLRAEIGCDITEKIPPLAISVGKVALSRLQEPLPAEPLYLRDADVTVSH